MEVIPSCNLIISVITPVAIFAIWNAEEAAKILKESEGNGMVGARILKLEKFFAVKKPKKMNCNAWLERLYEMEQKWEEEHQKPFPI